MQQYIDTITSSFVEQLPARKIYFEPQDLRELGYPDFFVDRVELELRRNLDDSIIVPETEWADMESEEVHQNWNEFLRAIHDVVRMPRSYAQTVFESAAADILEMLVQPRKQIVSTIFGPDDYLTLDQVRQNARNVTVYLFLPKALIRYMEKKELDEIGRNQADKIIQMVDDRVTGKYTPLNWAQLLDPWFTLLGQKVDSELLRQFFMDKDLHQFARHFDEEEGDIDRTRLIEILSTPDFDEEDRELSNYHQEHRDDEESYRRPFTFEADDSPLTTEYSYKSDADRDETSEHETSVDDLTSDSNADDPFERELESLKRSSAPADSEASDKKSVKLKDEPEEKKKQGSRSLLDDLSNEEETEEDEDESLLNLEKELAGEAEEDDEDEDIPIWKQFASEEDEDDENEEIKTSDEEAAAAEQEPIIDLTEDDDSSHDKEVEILRRHLMDQEDEIVDAIFSGDRNAFIEALDDLANFKVWEGASKYIWSEIFRINNVDRYAESSIDFIDRLQDYFLEKKKRID